MIDDSGERLVIRNVLEIVMSMARNDKELRQWAADHKEIIRQHLSDADKKYLTESYKQLLIEFEERKSNGKSV